jgi:hypothetical protein
LKEERGVTAKIIDLGLAKTLDESASEAGISSPGTFVGTPEFASPEQFGGVGVGIRSAPLPLEQLKGVPQPLVVLLEKLLQKDPAQRFHTPNELLKAMPTIIGAIDGGRRIPRQSHLKMPSAPSRVVTRKPPARRFP